MNNTPLSRSISRITLLNYCNRKYFFNYYTKFLKEYIKNQNIYRTTQMIKNLSSINMWIWQELHSMMSDYLNLLKDWKNSKKNIDELKNKKLQMMDIFFNQSKNNDYSKYKYWIFWLSEHFYKKNIDKEFEIAKKNLIIYFDKFLDSKLHSEIKDFFWKTKKIFIEPTTPNFENMKMEINHIKWLEWITLFTQPDFWFIINHNWKNIYYIYDRKSWKIPNYENKTHISNQLKVYAYKMLLKLWWIENFKNIKIFCYEVFLKEMKIFWWEINEDDILFIEDKILQDINIEKLFIKDWNIKKNYPLWLEKFPKTENINKCNTCRFREICKKLIEYNI